MRIVITGASGSIGRPLVKDFLSRGAKLLLVGRDPDALRTLFPGSECCSYDNLAEHCQGYDGLLHLAVLNNNASESADAFLRANLGLTQTVLLAAQSASIERFVYASTVQSLDARNQSPYATSKRAASELVAKAEGIDTRILHLAAVVGDRLAGKLAILDRLPPVLRKPLLELYAAITPVTDIATVVDKCWEALLDPDCPGQQIVARDQSRNPIFAVIKRCMDLGAALVILLPLIWLLAMIWFAVRLQSPGPGIFAQKRVGQNGEVFTCYKFRTMAQGSPNVGTHEASTTLVTPLGTFLRRTKLDELPQAFNILLNQMSLVGPRPSLPNQHAVISERQKLSVLSIKPGITGIAQINQVDMSQPELLASWDEQYVRLRSVRLDVSILLKTLIGRGNGDPMTTRDQ
ncbi:MAG: sugar transferase [Candidatus Devosia phytovorans]|uniref:Sugar transferase n=1 Tax=Candidatus Devosia phytovorans TaxID=3121372 RepID=A0AAJ5VTA5_9HYPH|nr:sugar transferase [Devosia sp.]WEK03775.1 MAG: sugar transferase [Devosia sp.]